MEEYLQHLFDVDALCNQFRTKTEKHFFTDRQTKLKLENISEELSLFCFTPLYQTYFRRIRRVLELCLDILAIKHMEKNRTALDLRIYWLEDPAKVKEYRTFDEAIGFIQRAFIDAKNEIEERLSLQSFSEFEINRLNEAIHCFFEGCYYSTVAASVYVIESKLLSLMKSVTLSSRLDKLTLGQLIREYLRNKEKYKHIIPKKYEPLLEHCNTYRIFSVHPKREEVNKPIATQILSMAFMFVLDKKLFCRTA